MRLGAVRETERILDGYRRDAETLIARYRAISSNALFAPVRAFLPPPPARVIDLGAGPGRDALWLAGLGHHVVAVEPVAAFREAGAAEAGSGAPRWIDDRLPELDHVFATARGPYDLGIVNAVWQHLAPGDRARAMHRIAQLLAPGGVLVLSLRHGPGAEGRRVFAVDPYETRIQADAAGLSVCHEERRASLQAAALAADVTWTWLVLRRNGAADPSA